MQLYWQVYNGDTTQTIYQGDALEVLRGLPPESVQCCITSPPYWGLRDYGVEGQIGLEPTLQEYIEALVEVFREVRRVLRPDGTLWLNLGDSYAGSTMSGEDGSLSTLVGTHHRCRTDSPRLHGHRRISPELKPKDLIGMPWRVAFALQADGWYLRSDIIWAKPNPMPESVTDRPTKAHEYVFLLAKAKRYFYDADAIREPHVRPLHAPGNKTHNGRLTASMGHFEEPDRVWGNPSGRNKRSVWTIATKPFPEAHFATFPTTLVEPMILAGTSPKACPHCGAPWKRVVKVESGQGEGKPYDSKRPDGLVFRGRNRPSKRTELGWYPTCSCPDNDGSGRCVVLDPFVGAGTTLLVAQRLERSGIGIELNPDYCAMASRRIDREQ